MGMQSVPNTYFQAATLTLGVGGASSAERPPQIALEVVYNPFASFGWVSTALQFFEAVDGAATLIGRWSCYHRNRWILPGSLGHENPR